MSKKFGLIIVIVLLFFTKSFCDINIETSIDKKDISIGENIILNIKITLPTKSILVKPEYDCIKDWYIKDITIKRDKINYNTYTIIMIITTFKAITNEIPAIEFDFIDENKNKHNVYTKPIGINIINTLSSNVAEIDKLKTVKTVKKLEIKVTYYYIFIIFLLYFFILFVIYSIKKRNTIKIFNTNRIKKDMIKQINELLLKDVDLETKYSTLFDIILNFLKIEYKMEYKQDIDMFILEMIDLDISSITLRTISDILNRVKKLREKDTKMNNKDFVKDSNNLKLIISNSIE